MRKRILLTVIVLLAATGLVAAQQAPDLKYQPPLPRPAYEAGKGPRAAIDEAHHNFHTADGRYRPFAELLGRDGYRVEGLGKSLSADSLRAMDVLVIANPLHERNIRDWSLPTPSAFTQDEIAALHTWVEMGGALLLIADHMPFPGAASDLAKAFGVEFSNGYARAGHWRRGKRDTFEHGTGLKESAVTRVPRLQILSKTLPASCVSGELPVQLRVPREIPDRALFILESHNELPERHDASPIL